MRTEKAGSSRALPRSTPTPATKARHRPMTDGEGVPCEPGPGVAGGGGCAGPGAPGKNRSSGLGITPVLAASATPPAETAASTAMALRVSTFASALFILDLLRGSDVTNRWALRWKAAI